MYQLPRPMPFSLNEYHDRMDKVKKLMAQSGLDAMLVTDPANIYYLTGFDAESFYVDQVLIIDIQDNMPTLIGRKMDMFCGARKITWLDEAHIDWYTDDYVQNPDKHAMDWISDKLKRMGFANKTIGIELQAFFISPYAWERYKANLPDAKFVNESWLVKKVRLVKSDQEVEYMRRAGKISEKMMHTFFEKTAAGVRLCDVAADIQHAAYSGTPEFGGESIACNMNFPRGTMGGAPHISWDDQPLPDNITMYLETAGVYKRYHAPFGRTLCIGKAPDKFLETADVLIEGLHAALGVIKAGVTCAEIAETFGKVMERNGLEKDSRMGYPIGIGYMPMWGEGTLSVRPIDHTVLQKNMCLHIIPGYYVDDIGITISQAICVTDNGFEKLYDVPYDVVMK